MDDLLNQIVNISKAGAFDIVSKHNQELQAENAQLKIKLKGAEERIKALKDFINDVKPKDAINAELGSTENDIPGELFISPSLLSKLEDEEVKNIDSDIAAGIGDN